MQTGRKRKQGDLQDYLTGTRNKKSKTSSLGRWRENGTLLWFEHDRVEHRGRIAAFDLDSTLVTTKRGKGFPTSSDDWRFLFDEKLMTGKLRDLHDKGYKLVIFTNQNGIAKGRVKDEDFKKRAEAVLKAIELPMQVFAATDSDHYRKPGTGMWDYLQRSANDGVPIEKEKSFYVGDAAGRPKGWKPRTGRDHSAADRKLALNIPLKFYTPEEYFLDEAAYNISDCGMGFNPHSIDLQNGVSLEQLREELLLSKEKQEIVVMVGRQASGKSTIAKGIFSERGEYVYVNRDTQKDVKRCVKVAREALVAGKSVVVDNTSPDIASRAPYIAMAKELNVQCRCVWLKTSPELAKHLNMMREIISEGVSKHVPNVAYNMYNKKFVAPTESEGFSSVKAMDWTPIFETDDQREQFLKWTESPR